MKAKGGGALNAAKTHCPKGHPYEGNNLLLLRKGALVRRQCRTCKNEQTQARNKRARFDLSLIRHLRDDF